MHFSSHISHISQPSLLPVPSLSVFFFFQHIFRLSVYLHIPPVTLYTHIYNDENDPVLYQASSLYQVNRN
jgi:hypothetical protein